MLPYIYTYAFTNITVHKMPKNNNIQIKQINKQTNKPQGFSYPSLCICDRETDRFNTVCFPALKTTVYHFGSCLLLLSIETKSRALCILLQNQFIEQRDLCLQIISFVYHLSLQHLSLSVIY